MDAKLAAQIGQAVRQARESLKLSQAEVAERLAKSPEFYGRMERGATLPSIETLADLVRVLGVGADTLLGKSSAAGYASTATRDTLTQKERLVLRRLRRASPRALRLVGMLLDELELAAGTSRRKAPRPGQR
ncbi:MAG: transcriptional regulator, family [Polyangiaceae bacterium]|jgi:transcriptional regulator with XRE-family HTH domain|nr:transcriptional regulator, family [Polyangiaceae bacterium]